MALTSKEREYLQGIVDSEYQTYEVANGPAETPVWSFNVSYDERSKGGVAASLVRKGLIYTYEDEGESICWITHEGVAAFTAAE